MPFTSSLQFYDSSQTENISRFIGNIRNSFIALGLATESVAGTGSVNLSTITGSNTANAIFGVDVFRFNDDLQSIAPVFIRVSYINVTARIALNIQIGTQVDVSGNLTGTQTTTRKTLSPASPYPNSGTTLYTNFYSGDTNRICFISLPETDTSNLTSMFSIERTKDLNGNDTPEGILYYTYGVSSTVSTQCISISGSIPAEETRATILLPALGGTATSNQFANKIIISPIFYFLGQPLPPGTNLAIASTADTTYGDIIDYQFYPNKPLHKYYGLRADGFPATAGPQTLYGAHRCFIRID